MGGRLDGRVSLVTGASRGIGYAAALAFAREGAHVVAVARTVGGLEELDDEIRSAGGQATLVPLDLRDMEAIDRLGAALYERWGHLDVALLNAGILGVLSPLGHIEPKLFEDVLQINVTANWRLLRSLDPLLRRSEAGRVVALSSGAAHKCRPFWGAYSASKAALEALVRTYAAEHENGTIRAMLVNPGPMRTAMRAKAMPGEDPKSLPEPASLAPHLVEMALPSFERTGMLFDFPTGKFLEFQAPVEP